MCNDLASPPNFPEKRALEEDAEVSRKVAKIDLLQDGRMPARPMPKTILQAQEPPSISAEDESTSVPATNSLAAAPGAVECSSDSACGPDALVRAKTEVRRIFRDIWIAFAIERDSTKGDEVAKSEAACKMAEKMATERYEELKEALLALLPWVGEPKPARPTAEGRNYNVIEYEGKTLPKHLTAPNMKDKKGTEVGADILQKAQLEWFRPHGEREQAWESLTEAMSAIACRSEMSWLEGITIASEIQQKLKKVKGCKKRGSEARNEWIRQYIIKQEQFGCGNFLSHLMHHGETVRVSLVPGIAKPIPATAVITCREPLWDALLREDDEGPIRFPGMHPDTNKMWTQKQKTEWLRQPGRQFAFQLANLDGDAEDPHDNRKPARDLNPDAQLRNLLRSRKPVIHLEVVAALAPRDVMKKEGLSEIVKSELHAVMRTAKDRGEAVIFCLGSSNPHVLAKKVYLRPPIGDCGLKCGYIRWKNSPDEPWHRERCWDMRMCFCLQMP